ncbi:MAG: poly-gamma-glutamate hydrolase family protein [Desulfobacterales bacterium]|nr:poly-gamma-glutamate hydrolase family protein [Desulfobacterales bacterium]MDJ0884137.1 poly-gamma-glutamate hydrolase family protein [Desulfobacterales bacterium]
MPYRSFRELARHEQPMRDYRVRSRLGRTGLLVMAPHGGGIEPGTDILAAILAGRRHALYSFLGLKPRGNRDLHITSHRFDEPLARRMTRRAVWVLTIHGCAQTKGTIRIGGRDREGGRIFKRCLQQAGFRARRYGGRALAGRHPANLCNRGRRGKGVQLEIDRDLRETLGRSNCMRRLVRALSFALAALPAAATATTLSATGGHPWKPINPRPTINAGMPSPLPSSSPSR